MVIYRHLYTPWTRSVLTWNLREQHCETRPLKAFLRWCDFSAGPRVALVRLLPRTSTRARCCCWTRDPTPDSARPLRPRCWGRPWCPPHTPPSRTVNYLRLPPARLYDCPRCCQPGRLSLGRSAQRLRDRIHTLIPVTLAPVTWVCVATSNLRLLAGVTGCAHLLVGKELTVGLWRPLGRGLSHMKIVDRKSKCLCWTPRSTSLVLPGLGLI